MLVGVLIGHNTAGSGTRTVASAPVRIIKVGGGGATSSGSTAGSGSASGSGGSTASSAKRKHVSHAKPKPKKVTPKIAPKTANSEQSAASKVLGGKSTPPATVTVGQSGTGKGFNKKTHKFDGSFFGQ